MAFSTRLPVSTLSAISGLALVAGLLGAPAHAQVGTPAGAGAPQGQDINGGGQQTSNAPAGTPGASGGTSSDGPTGTEPGGTPPGSESDIVVTGFRASLNSALNLKKNETAAVDSIVSEDIGKFPDSNLAESMQRIPGISLARGDGGEGRNISVRGLGAQFTRVRINGMEGSAQTGGSDIQGAGNSGRSFDFNVFPSEIFSSLAVRKTTSADVEEGSLGATVDLRAPHPLDQKTDFVFTATGRGVYNEISKKVDPRFSALISKQFADGTFGILASGAYQKRHIREVGYSAVDILSSNTNGVTTNGTNQLATSGRVSVPFCTPVGYTRNGVPFTSPTIGFVQNGVSIGADANNCSTGNPRTSTTAAFNTVYNLTRPDAPTVPGSGAFLPRIPRYVNSTQNAERIGGSLSLQWSPDDDTNVSLDGVYSRYDVTRRDNYISAISFGRSITNLGQPTISVRDIAFDSNGSLQYGLFDGVDVRSEGLVDHFTTTFKQGNLSFKHKFSDAFEVNGMAGYSSSIFAGKQRLQTFIDAIDTDNFTIDFRDGNNIPKLGFGIDVSNPSNFNYAPSRPDGTFLGGFSTGGRPSQNKTINQTYELNGIYHVTPDFAFQVGGQWRRSDYTTRVSALYSAFVATRALPAGTTLDSITTQITGVGNLLGRGAPNSWVAIDSEKWKQAFNFASYPFCTTADCGNGTSRVRETVKSGYLMATFNTDDMLPIPIRGDAGVRYVHTDQLSVGFIPSALASSPTGVTGLRAEVDRSYADWLPSANIVFELTPKLLLRGAMASVMSRAQLGQLIPSSGVTATTRTGSINNPYLDPIRATTYDLGLEWYFQPGSLLSFAYYRKNIKTYIQSLTTLVPFTSLGLPDALLANTNTTPSELFTISQPTNTPGGPLKGYEVNAQVQFRFLPGILKNFGVLANYNHVTSKITYILSSSVVNGQTVQVTTVQDLVGLSRKSASGTLYYDDGRFSIRGTASYRGPYLRGVPASLGSDAGGTLSNTFVDGSVNYNLTDNIKLIFEVQNITDERNTLTIDTTRQDTYFETRLGRTFNLGATVKF